MLPWDQDMSTPIAENTRKKILDAAKNEMINRGYTFMEKGGQLTVG